VKEEESTIFSLARKLLDRDELKELGEKMESAKQRLLRSEKPATAKPTARETTSARKKSLARKTTAKRR
jgi:hypothetical protein